MTLRVLQVIADTADSPANLAALRHHELLAANGIEIRTLALAPGLGHVVPRTVPTMAPSVRSIAAYTQLRRELRWPDVALAVDHLPRAMTGRSKVPVVAVSGSGSARGRFLTRITQEAIVSGVVVPAGDHDHGRIGDGATGLRTPYLPRSASVAATDSSRRAARAELGITGEGIVSAEIDPDSGDLTAIHVVQDGSVDEVVRVVTPGRRRSATNGDDASVILELVVHAADVIIPSRAPSVAAPDALHPVLVDMMNAGAVPVGWPAALDSELLVDDDTAIFIDDAGREPGGDVENAADHWSTTVVRTLVALDGDRSRVRQLSSNVAAETARLCDPQVILGQWSGILDQALPSQT